MNRIIKDVLEKITLYGYDAYIVGGYVRDYILGKDSKDIDICTSMDSKTLSKVFNTKDNKYGSIHFSIEDYNFDITTYRCELEYSGRWPSKIEYTSNLEEDLVRRDFTINTICMNKDEYIIDYYDGIKDINKKVIKSIGNASKKIKEDPSRILRAIRFASILDFKIDKSLNKAIKNNYRLVSTLSSDFIRKEFDKILSNYNYKIGLKLLKKYKILDLLNISVKNIVYCHNILGMYAQMNIDNISFTKKEKNSIIKIKEIISHEKIDNNCLNNYELDELLIAAEIMNIDKNNIVNYFKRK